MWHNNCQTLKTWSSGYDIPASKHLAWLFHCPSKSSKFKVSLFCAEWECSISRLCLLKTCLCSIMKEAHLNGLAMLHCICTPGSMLMWCYCYCWRVHSGKIQCFLGHKYMPYSMGFCVSHGRKNPLPHPFPHGHMVAVASSKAAMDTVGTPLFKFLDLPLLCVYTNPSPCRLGEAVWVPAATACNFTAVREEKV